MPGLFFREFQALSLDWMVGSFVGATFDFVFSLLHSKSHLLNTISALIQFTCVTFICHEVLYSIGARRSTNTIQETWLLYTSVYEMSPNAIDKLSKSYYAFHRLLYGTRSLVPDLPEVPEVPSIPNPQQPVPAPTDPAPITTPVAQKRKCNKSNF